MKSVIVKVIWILWNAFAPESAKVMLGSVAKDLIKILTLIIVACLLSGFVFFAGSYFFAQGLLLYINYPVICYLISIPVCFILTIMGMYILFRYIIRKIIKRAQTKGGVILNNFN